MRRAILCDSPQIRRTSRKNPSTQIIVVLKLVYVYKYPKLIVVTIVRTKSSANSVDRFKQESV
jgi:hypothetical protein